MSRARTVGLLFWKAQRRSSSIGATGHGRLASLNLTHARFPLYCAFGKVLIAFQPAQWRGRFLQDAKLRKLATGTVLNRTVLSTEIERIRHTGLHISMAENLEDAGSLSVPVFDATSRLLGALFVTAPLERLGARQIERYRDLLFDAASKITSALRRENGRRSARLRT